MIINALEYLEISAKEKSEKVVYRDERNEISFSQLLEKSQAIGSTISKMTGPRKPVVVITEKDIHTPAMFFGVLYSGCFYVPISTDLPKFRINLILETVSPQIIVAQEMHRDFIDSLDWDASIVMMEDAVCSEIDHDKLDQIRSQVMDTDPAYVIFTSGSTGKPKGVVESHRQLIDYIEAFSEAFQLTEHEIYGNQSPLDYIAAIRDLYLPLKTGATTILIPKQYFSTPQVLFQYLNDNRVTVICWVVGALLLCSELKTFDHIKLETVNKVFFTGSVMPSKHLKVWQENLPEALFVNHYGPTEITASCTYYVLDHVVNEDETIPIGVPFRNTGILLLNENNEEAKAGETGEICVRGTSLALGYYNNREKTKEVFISNPCNEIYDEIIYATGDLGKYNDKGELLFLGRKDHQIKHMGHRVELGEIETVSLSMPEITEAVSLYHKEKQQIFLFYVGDVDVKTLARYLREKLPSFMIPRKYIQLESMPLSFNGKVNLTELGSMMKNGK